MKLRTRVRLGIFLFTCLVASAAISWPSIAARADVHAFQMLGAPWSLVADPLPVDAQIVPSFYLLSPIQLNFYAESALQREPAALHGLDALPVFEVRQLRVTEEPLLLLDISPEAAGA